MKSNVLCLLLLTGLWAIPARSADAPAKPAPPTAAPTAVKRVGIEEYEKLRTNANAVVLDVRSAAEFEKGHIPGAINIDINSTKFPEAIGALDKSKTYLVNCAVGMRSAKASRKMESMGFTNLFDLSPGFDGWKKAGKPVVK